MDKSNKIDQEKLSRVVEDVLYELEDANKKHGSFSSAHEAYAVLLEEADELWDEVKKKEQDHIKMYDEAKQIASIAIRFMMQL